ncbi:MAG: CotH kinase family protein [Bacteroidota bacterium]
MKNYILFFVVSAVLSLRINAQTFTSSNLPIVVINTHGQEILNEPKITADMGIIDNGEGIRNLLTDSLNAYDGKIGIEIRGSSSQMFPKKQYGFETRDSAGDDNKVPLLGLPSESDWILFAAYNDKSLMRDALTYTLSNSLGRYASRSRYCELVLNGEYRGVYILLEKIKRDKNRVNISKLDETGITGDALTGGYIIKVDKLDGSGNDGWYSNYATAGKNNQKILYQYDYPKPEDITPEQKQYISFHIFTFETVMSLSTYADTVNGYSKYLDVPSVVDFFLVNELTRNVDAYRLSSYLYKDKDSKNSKMFLGPVWDFNAGFGNSDYYQASSIEGWQLVYLATNDSFRTVDGFQIPFWWKKIYDDTLFMKKVSERWKGLRANQFSLTSMYHFIDSVAAHINEAQQRNFVKWPILNQYVWPNAYVGGTYPNEIAYLKSWIKKRIDWMDIQLAGTSLGVAGKTDRQPVSYRLSQNYPNPFNPNTVINYQLAMNGYITLKVYDLVGREIAVLANGMQEAGEHSVQWNAGQLPSGIYFYRLQSEKFVATKKLLLLK